MPRIAGAMTLCWNVCSSRLPPPDTQDVYSPASLLDLCFACVLSLACLLSIGSNGSGDESATQLITAEPEFLVSEVRRDNERGLGGDREDSCLGCWCERLCSFLLCFVFLVFYVVLSKGLYCSGVAVV